MQGHHPEAGEEMEAYSPPHPGSHPGCRRRSQTCPSGTPYSVTRVGRAELARHMALAVISITQASGSVPSNGGELSPGDEVLWSRMEEEVALSTTDKGQGGHEHFTCGSGGSIWKLLYLNKYTT